MDKGRTYLDSLPSKGLAPLTVTESSKPEKRQEILEIAAKQRAEEKREREE